MKKILLFAMMLLSVSVFAQWQSAGDKIKTQWAETLDTKNLLPESPRPIMKRSAWTNLNGLWKYSIVPANQQEPKSFDGQILVPFAVESSVSGVMKPLEKNNELWYKRTFAVPSKWKDKNILLHFGAVNWKTEVFINDIKVGSHTGGYTPFSFVESEVNGLITYGRKVIKVEEGRLKKINQEICNSLKK
ncbi:hypothetical protein JCM30204_08990 [Dysgonomonas termitidis]